jgi:iron complex outermembrane receptor protein
LLIFVPQYPDSSAHITGFYPHVFLLHFFKGCFMKTLFHSQACIYAVWVVCLYVFCSELAFAQYGDIAGKVTDGLSGEALAGVKITIETTKLGAASNKAGEYSIKNVPAGAYKLIAKSIGYEAFSTDIQITDGQVLKLDIAMVSATFQLEDLVVTGSRKAEKIVDAPASISVVQSKKIERDVTMSPELSLRNLPGVDITTVGVNRQQVAIRGFSQPFIGPAFILTDFRQTVTPGLGVNAFQIMPLISSDIERVEVVRGPSSALYGSGADVGVIHFITKDPFDKPGNAISLGGGSQSTLFLQFRHANKVSENLAYKIVGGYNRAQDWALDVNDPSNDWADRRENNRSVMVGAPFADTVLGGLNGAERIPHLNTLPRDRDVYSANLAAMIKYKFDEQTALTVNAGAGQASFSLLATSNAVQIKDYLNWFAQARFESGGFFAQVYYNKNFQGRTYNYNEVTVQDANGRRTPRMAGDATTLPSPTADLSAMFVGQAQYAFDWKELGLNVIAGVDYEFQDPITNAPTDSLENGRLIGRVHGRNEGRDQAMELGAYAQVEKKFGESLILNGSLRYDYLTALRVGQFSPRIAAVYKLDAENSIRASYNRAFSSPVPLQMFLDLNVAQSGPFTVRARGTGLGFRFDRDEQGRPIAYSTGLLPGLAPTGTPLAASGSANGPQLPLNYVWQALVAGGLLSSPSLAPLAAQLRTLQLQGGVGVVGLGGATSAGGNIAIPGQTNAQNLTDIVPLKPTTQQTIEVSYQGFIAKSIIASVDVYFSRRENFVAPLTIISPFAYAGADLIPQFQNSLSTAIAGNAGLVSTLRAALGMPNASADQVAGALAGQIATGARPTLNSLAVAPFGVYTPAAEGDFRAANQAPLGRELTLAYQNFGAVAYWGVDASLEVPEFLTKELSIFGVASYMSSDFFSARDLGEANVQRFVSLNTPTFKARLGADYTVPQGLSANATVRYQNAFPVASGVALSGNPADRSTITSFVNAMTLVDVGVGYDFDALVKGLRVDITAQNVLDNRQRQYIGAPAIGRMVLAKATYTF